MIEVFLKIKGNTSNCNERIVLCHLYSLFFKIIILNSGRAIQLLIDCLFMELVSSRPLWVQVYLSEFKNTFTIIFRLLYEILQAFLQSNMKFSRQNIKFLKPKSP